MKELAGRPIDDNSYELMVLQGLRALLGDEKGQRAMVDLQSSSPAACEQVMAEAQARYDALSPEQREDPSRILAEVSASILKLKFKKVGKNIPKITIMVVPKLLKSMFTSIPKVLKRIFIKQ